MTDPRGPLEIDYHTEWKTLALRLKNLQTVIAERLPLPDDSDRPATQRDINTLVQLNRALRDATYKIRQRHR
jgi:hypothetical protein